MNSKDYLEGDAISLRSYASVPIQDIEKQYLRWINNKKVVIPIASPSLLEIKDSSFIEESYRRFTSPTCTGFFIWHNIDSKFIGTAKIDKIDLHNKSAEVGMMIGETDYWGQRIGTQTMSILLDYLFELKLFHRAWGGANALNTAMCRVFIKSGFTQEGILREASLMNGAYTDNYYYGLLNSEYLLRKHSHA